MTYDFAPLFRSTIGFERLARAVDGAAQAANAASYPPYNIEKTGESSYVLTMAVAGFGPDDIELSVQENTLVLKGRLAAEPKGEILHRGIAARAFERRFGLAEHIVVDNADLAHGLLHVVLKRVVPGALKPRRIAIGTSAAANDKQIEGAQAA